MRTLSGERLDLEKDKILKSVISKEFTLEYYNLRALKNIFVQDLRTKESNIDGLITGAIIGGMIDGSVGDDSVVDGAVLGSLLFSSKDEYVIGNIYVTLQFFDGQTLNLKLDDEAELIVLQDYAIKNHSKKSLNVGTTRDIIQLDKKSEEKNDLQALIISLLMFIVLLIDVFLGLNKAIFITLITTGLSFLIFNFYSSVKNIKQTKQAVLNKNIQ